MKAILFPGQGSQGKGMGANLFARFPDLTRTADAILGYSIRELCVDDPRNELTKTEFAQPAIYVTSVLGYLDGASPPDCLAGHSVGEYAALTAARVFDFATGLRLVRQRGRLMARAEGGGMAAIVGASLDEVERTIAQSGLGDIEVANINSPVQIVVGGPRDALRQFVAFCGRHKLRAVPLRVSGAFHTSMMRAAATEFRGFLAEIDFARPCIPVIANLTAEPHEADAIADTLARHIASPVLWSRGIERMLQMGIETFDEIGSAQILVPMIAQILARAETPASAPPSKVPAAVGRESFADAFGCASPLAAGALGRGISGVELTSALASGGFLAIFDTDDLDPEAISRALSELPEDPGARNRIGAALTARPDDPRREDILVDLFLRHGVSCVETRGFDEPSPALLRYRSRGGLSASGRPVNRVIARIASAEAIERFLRATARGACAVADALCVDSEAWRSSVEPPASLLFDALGRRDAYQRAYPQAPRVFVGASGRGGSAAAVQALLSMGADFAMPGSVFLTAREARLDDAAKQALMDASHEHFQRLPDWWFPEFATTSWSYASDTDAVEQSRALQTLYRKPEIDAAALRMAMRPYSESTRLLPESFVDACESLQPRELRERLRARLADVLFPKIVACDASLAQFNAWMRQDANPLAADRSALAIAARLSPRAVTKGKGKKPCPS